MNSRELRIGNWVCHIPSKNETASGNFIVSEIRAFAIETINGLQSEDIEPIPLTEEWLLRFGFNKIKMESILYSKYSKGYLGGIEIDLRKSEIEGWQITYCNYAIKYIHQLQNLYFALTGEELTIKNDANN